MDKVNNCISELHLLPPRKKTHPQAVNQFNKLPATLNVYIENCKNNEDRWYGLLEYCYDETHLELICEDRCKLEIIFLYKWLVDEKLNPFIDDTDTYFFDYMNDETGDLKYGGIWHCYEQKIKPIMDKYYPDELLNINSGIVLIEYNMRIKDTHFQMVYETLYSSVDTEYLCNNPYKHKSDLKKKFMKNELYIEKNGKKSVDHQLVMFKRLFQLEMERQCIN